MPPAIARELGPASVDSSDTPSGGVDRRGPPAGHRMKVERFIGERGVGVSARSPPMPLEPICMCFARVRSGASSAGCAEMTPLLCIDICVTGVTELPPTAVTVMDPPSWQERSSNMATASQPTTTSPEQTTTEPNQYRLHGGQISVEYFPGGSGPPVQGRGSTFFTYRDAHQSHSFGKDEVDVVDVASLGTIVSVVFPHNPDVGYTSFSLLVPRVVLPARFTTEPIHTEGITTGHRGFIRLIGQDETYHVTRLTGSASDGFLPV
jgi:hypothetical protein